MTFLFQHAKNETLRGYLCCTLGQLDNNSFFKLFGQIDENYEEIGFKFRFLKSHKIDKEFLEGLNLLQTGLQVYFWKNICDPWLDDSDLSVLETYIRNTAMHRNCNDALLLAFQYKLEVETYILVLESVLRFGIKADAYLALEIFEKIYMVKDISEDLKERLFRLEEAYAKIFTEGHYPRYLLSRLRSDPRYSAYLKLYGRKRVVTLLLRMIMRLKVMGILVMLTV